IEFIEKAAAIVHHINAGGILVIDEIESSLHPKLVCFLNEYINGDQNKSAQVIYTTHCYDLLNFKVSGLRHDQIYFTEKNKDQSTSLFTLANFNERKDVSVYKKYFEGSYSLQNLENLQKGDIK
ncbi:MAG: AAA family ATPase, partial [Candidatus ainarchaeum sp.]|nr:AAA family ATPase [Candidatus ainarchaeum sp.]